ncbi:MAG: hypothetical protein EKK48_17910 [Candidatus Melainabacteria bacterium]|nr:MAG: hypothetical protein EKK48_17910 [Candidatus Melainabacteria bacterium]
MTHIPNVFGKCLIRCWKSNRSLTALIVFSVSVLIVSMFGLCFDQRMVLGEHPWIKPVKFSASLAIFGVTLFWLGQFLTNHTHAFRRTCRAALSGSIAELSIIIIQVMRGAPNHFNMGSSFDNGMAWLAAISILPVAFSIVVVFFLLLREPNLPAVLGCALRWGVLLSVIGCIPGFMMLAPVAMQHIIVHQVSTSLHQTSTGLQQASTNLHQASISLQQTSSGIPFLGWSTVSGDLRVAHFVGIHALQFFPVLAFIVMKLLPNVSILRKELLIGNIGLTYLGVIALLTHQALIAEPITAPSHHTLAYAVILALASVNAAVYILFAPSHTVTSKLQEAES